MNEIKFLMEVKDFGYASIEDMKRFMYDNCRLWDMHQFCELSIEGTLKKMFDLEDLLRFSQKSNIHLKILLFNRETDTAITVKEVKNGELIQNILDSINEMDFKILRNNDFSDFIVFEMLRASNQELE